MNTLSGNIRIRPMEPRDRETVLAMMRDFYDSPALILTPSDQVLINNVDACLSGSPFVEGYVFEAVPGQMPPSAAVEPSPLDAAPLAGYGMLAHSFSTEAGGTCVWIEDVYLLPEFRRKGIGSRFFRYVRDRYGDTAARIRLEVEPDNEKAIRFYESEGYQVLGYQQMIIDKEI